MPNTHENLGWALTLLSPESLTYASTCQTVGLNTGYFASFTVFLAFNSEDFAYAPFLSRCVCPLLIWSLVRNGAYPISL